MGRRWPGVEGLSGLPSGEPGAHNLRWRQLSTLRWLAAKLKHPSPLVAASGLCRLAVVGLDLADPAVDEREELLGTAVGQFGQRDFRPLAAQVLLTVEARYP